jgi:hypothetical protein
MQTPKALKWAGGVLGVFVGVFAAAQLVQPEHVPLKTDPSHAIQAQLAPTSNLGVVLDRACGDCHSNVMSSRWYTRVTPFSFLIARGAQEGRKVVNFSEWTTYTPEQRRAFLLASCADARAGTMPMPAYLRFRPDARLSPTDVATICGASQ